MGGGIAHVKKLWLELRKRTLYKPRLHVLPWAFVWSTTHKQQEGSLQLHVEKKALAALLACNEIDLTVSIEFNACLDCHEFFKSLSLLEGRFLWLRQPRVVHAFTDGRCSCGDVWRW